MNLACHKGKCFLLSLSRPSAICFGNLSEVSIRVESAPRSANELARFVVTAKRHKCGRLARSVARSTEGKPIISYDDGKTWSVFDPAGQTVPESSTVKEANIDWEKKED